jgi:hypothetical protein
MLQFDNLKFLHPVGVSTFRYGVTIPLEAQTELRAIENGGKVPVAILCGNDEPVEHGDVIYTPLPCCSL